jgi:hypothetical protein
VGTERDELCLGCLESALSGHCDGRCHNAPTGTSTRCARCKKSSHAFKSIPNQVKDAAFKFLEVYRSEQTSSSQWNEMEV